MCHPFRTSKILISLTTLFSVKMLFSSKSISSLTLLVFIPFAQAANNQEQALEKLLKNLQSIQQDEHTINAERERAFVQARDQQKKLLAEQKAIKAALEKEYQSLRQQVKSVNEALKAQKSALDEASLHLQDIFSLTRQVAQDNQREIQSSLTSSQYPELGIALDVFNQTDHIPSTKDLQALWLALLNEISAAGEITYFYDEYFDLSGTQQSGAILRAGPFTARNETNYLILNASDTSLSTLADGPSLKIDQFAELENKAAGDIANIDLFIDPTQGQLFKTLSHEKTLLERIEQGGIVGMVIIGLGLLGLILCAIKLIQLSTLHQQIKKQLAQPADIQIDNPLGRILSAGQTHHDQHSQDNQDNKAQQDDSSQEYDHALIQGLEIKLNEAIMKEAPTLEKGSGFIKLLATVAPLLGLLGTVTGMIATFQAITLFGAGDPKLMAGGISQALVTTVLGLVVAIPLLFGHNMIVQRARTLLVVLSQESLALVANSIQSQSLSRQTSAPQTGVTQSESDK